MLMWQYFYFIFLIKIKTGFGSKWLCLPNSYEFDPCSSFFHHAHCCCKFHSKIRNRKIIFHHALFSSLPPSLPLSLSLTTTLPLTRTLSLHHTTTILVTLSAVTAAASQIRTPVPSPLHRLTTMPPHCHYCIHQDLTIPIPSPLLSMLISQREEIHRDLKWVTAIFLLLFGYTREEEIH